MNKELIGVGITTCNRPDLFSACINSIDFNVVDYVVVVNDGSALPSDIEIDNRVIIINNETNLGVSKTKNKALKMLLDLQCEHIFTIEDDCIIKDNNIFNKYIEAFKTTKIPHFNYGPGSPWNRKQKPGLKGKLDKRHLADQTTDPDPKLTIKYNQNVSISLYEHIVAMFCYFHKSILEQVGLMDEEFYNAWEHVEHTYRIIKAKKYTPFWWFADISDSQNYIQEAPNEKGRTTLAKNEEKFKQQVLDGLKVFRKKHNTIPSEIVPTKNVEEIKNLLKSIYNS